MNVEKAIELYRPAMPVMSIEQAVERHKQMAIFVQRIMIDGTDYGTVPGTNKPTLLKPGAEKLTTFFGLSPRFIPVKEIERWGFDGTEPFFYYWYKCQLWRGDILVGEGDGSCNSHESKYRWRWVSDDALPPGADKDTLRKRGGTTSEFRFAVEAAETTGRYGKSAEYWQQFTDAIANGTARATKRKTRKGQEYDAWEIDATAYRVPNDDIASQVNTVNKMAQKRALIAATLIAVNASEFFTQDLEDWGDNDVVEYPAAQSTSSPEPEQPPPPAAPPQRPYDAATVKAGILSRVAKAGDGQLPASEAQAQFLARKFAEAFAPAMDAIGQYHISLAWLSTKDSANDLTMAWASKILDWLLGGNKPDATGDTPLSQYASAEAGNVYRQAMADQGQTEMELPEGES